jgi:cytochrome b561
LSDSQQIQSFSPVAKFLHWAVAILILGLLACGFFMVSMALSPLKLEIFGLHKSFGMTVLALAAIRVIWRFAHPPPAHLPTHALWERVLAKISHGVLYAAMFAMPLSGWVMSSAAEFPNIYFGLFTVPDIVTKNEDLFEIARDIHTATAFVILGVLALHMAGAFKHHFIDRDATLQRMSAPRLGFIGGALMVVMFGSLWLLAAGAGVLLDDDHHHEDDVMEQRHEQAVDDASPTPVQAGDYVWTIVPDKSRIRFTASQYGTEFEGEFAGFGGTIVFNPDDLENSHVDVKIDISTISTGSTDRDSQARTADWFNVSAYPQAIFTARRFERIDANHYIAHGELAIRDIKKPLSLPFSLEIDESDEGVQEAEMESEIRLKRLDYGVGQGPWQKTDAIADDVRLKISVEATRPVTRNVMSPP